jgi:methionyl-tRNA formyltransferase
MFDTIILLTGPAEMPVLTSALRSRNPGIAIRGVGDAAELSAIEPSLLRRARLIAFVTGTIVPARLLKLLGFGAYNFHPGPPHYPGRYPSHFAIYDRAAFFGATAHVMVESVDAGPIVACKYFPVPAGVSVAQLEALSYAELARLFWNLAERLAGQSAPLDVLPIGWSGTKSSRQSLKAMCELPPDISADELDRRIAAFGDGYHDAWPTLTLHGHAFRFVGTPPVVEAPSLVPATAQAPMRTTSNPA